MASLCPSCPSGQVGTPVQDQDILTLSTRCGAVQPLWIVVPKLRSSRDVSCTVLNDPKYCSSYLDGSKIPTAFEDDPDSVIPIRITASGRNPRDTIHYGDYITLQSLTNNYYLAFDTSASHFTCWGTVSYYYIWRQQAGSDAELFRILPVAGKNAGDPVLYGDSFFLKSELVSPATANTCNLSATDLEKGQGGSLCQLYPELSNLPNSPAYYMMAGFVTDNAKCIGPVNESKNRPLYLPWPYPFLNTSTSRFQFYQVGSPSQAGKITPFIRCVAPSQNTATMSSPAVTVTAPTGGITPSNVTPYNVRPYYNTTTSTNWWWYIIGGIVLLILIGVILYFTYPRTTKPAATTIMYQ